MSSSRGSSSGGGWSSVSRSSSWPSGWATSHSAISRIESGQHATSVQTLQRLAEALEMRFVLGFEHGPPDQPIRELVPA